MRGVGVVVALIVMTALVSVTGCSSWRGPKGFEPVRFEEVPPVAGDTFPNWPVPPHEAAVFMSSADYEVESVQGASAGTGGAEKVNLTFEGYEHLDIKVKPVPDDLDGINNAPRKELAAYVLQQLFLEPEEYVVPTSAIRCIPVAEWTPNHGGNRAAQVPGTHCVLANGSLWLKDVMVPRVLYDTERFLTDPVYARYLADFNLFTYLADSSDSRSGNVLVSKDDARRQVFAIDNGITFNPFWYNYFVPNWNIIRVAALRKKSVDRLRQLTEEDLNVLRVVWQMENDGTGQMQVVKPGPPIDPDDGVSMKDGVVQFGLTDDEVEHVWERLEDLLEDVDDGKIPLF
jgi:hypothetical protein